MLCRLIWCKYFEIPMHLSWLSIFLYLKPLFSCNLSFKTLMMDPLAKYRESLMPILSITSTLYVSADPLKARSLFVIPISSKNGRIFSSICRFVSFLVFFRWNRSACDNSLLLFSGFLITSFSIRGYFIDFCISLV